MSRSWQYVGFNKAAKAILETKKKAGTVQTIQRDLNGNVVSDITTDRLQPAYTREEYKREDVWYGSENVFYRYTFDDGRVLEDYTQLEPWSSGPMTYMALRDAVTKEPLPETLWDEKKILAGDQYPEHDCDDTCTAVDVG